MPFKTFYVPVLYGDDVTQELNAFIGSHCVVQEELPEWLTSIAQRLSSGIFSFGRFHQFLIRDPKERIITAPCFEERVVHHAIINIFEPVLDRWLIDDTFACRIGRGREAAIDRAMQFCSTNPWCLKLDVRKYFDSIDHDRLLGKLLRRIKEAPLHELLDRIVRSFRKGIVAGTGLCAIHGRYAAAGR